MIAAVRAAGIPVLWVSDPMQQHRDHRQRLQDHRFDQILAELSWPSISTGTRAADWAGPFRTHRR